MCLQVHADDRALFVIRTSLLRVHIFPSSGWTCCQSCIQTLLLSQILYNKQRKNANSQVSSAESSLSGPAGRCCRVIQDSLGQAEQL